MIDDREFTCLEIQWAYMVVGIQVPEHCSSCHSEWSYFERAGEDWRVDSCCCTFNKFLTHREWFDE